MRPDSSELEIITARCLWMLIELLKKRTLKALFFYRKPLKTTQLVIDSCRLVSQSNYLDISNNVNE